MRIHDCNLFNNIKDSDVNKLLTCLNAHEVKFDTGAEVFSYEKGRKIIGVVSVGKIQIKKIDFNGNSTMIEQVSKNGVFSDLFTYSDSEANYITAYATEPTKVIFFDYQGVFKRCEKACRYHSTFVENLLNIVVLKSQTLSLRVEILTNKTIRDKILSYVNVKVKQEGSNVFTIPMSLTSLAEYLCVDRSAMMRELKKLSNENVLKTNKREFKLLNKEYI